MHRLFIAAIIIFCSSAIMAQTPDKSISKREMRKKMENLQDSISHVKAIQAINDKEFVLEADYLTLKRGRVVIVNSTTNFVSLSGDKAVVQVVPYNSSPGINGIGGITLEGRASNIKVETDKRGNTYFSMNVLGTGISATVFITLNTGNNRASVTINQNTRSGKITLNGYLVPLEESSIYEGRSL